MNKLSPHPRQPPQSHFMKTLPSYLQTPSLHLPFSPSSLYWASDRAGAGTLWDQLSIQPLLLGLTFDGSIEKDTQGQPGGGSGERETRMRELGRINRMTLKK